MIRLAKVEDAKKITLLYNSDFNLRGENSNKSLYYVKNILEYLKNKKNKMFVFEEKREVLGVLFAEFHCDYIYLHTIIVDKKARGKGIATSLLNKLQEEARKKNVRLIEAFTEEKNVAMQRLFEKLNYKRGKRFIYYSNFK